MRARKVVHRRSRWLLLESLAGGERVAAEELGCDHCAFACGLDVQEFQGAVAGGDEEAGGGFEDVAGARQRDAAG